MAVYAVFVTMCALNAASENPPIDAISEAEIRERLDELGPAYPAPFVDVLRGPGEAWPSVSLLGVNVEQTTETQVMAGALSLDRDSPLRITAFWVPRVELQTPLTGEIRIAAHANGFAETHPIPVGPRNGQGLWAPGSVYMQEYTLDLSSLPASISGRAYIEMNLSSRQVDGRKREPLQSLAVYVPPVMTASTVREESIRSIGDRVTRLGTAFRLGYEAQMNVPIPESLAGEVGQLGFVSAFSYGMVNQGEPVCEVDALTANGEHLYFTLKSGLSTARGDYDFYSAGEQRHKKIRIIESIGADYRNRADRAFQKHKYVALFPWPEGAGRPQSLRFRSVTGSVFDVYDVLLVRTKTE